MKLASLSNRVLGNWTGTKELYLTGPPDPDGVSDSALVVAPVAKGKFISFAYTWEFKGTSHEGFLLVGGKDGVATTAWVDSFHQSGSVMAFEGSIDEEGRANVLGSYEAPPGPDWGWRIEIAADGEQLLIIMHNISPNGEEMLAVKATYGRT